MLTECAQLEAFRLDRDWTWAELADHMAEKGIQMSPRTLHYLLKRAPRGARPLDRTLNKIRKYLKATEAERPAPDAVAEDLLTPRRRRARATITRRRSARVS